MTANIERNIFIDRIARIVAFVILITIGCPKACFKFHDLVDAGTLPAIATVDHTYHETNLYI